MPKIIKDEDKLLDTIRRRFSRCEAAEKTIREAATRDLRFLVGQQWDPGVPEARRAAGRPALTINKLPPFCDQISNEQRKNRPGVKVSPVGGGADQQTSEIYEGIIRHIEYASQADTAYDTAFDYAVSSSFGAWRYTTDYCDDRSTHQDIRVTRIADPSTVFFDPNAQEVDASDGMFCFVFVKISKDEHKARYPEAEASATNFDPPGGWQAAGWIQGDDVIVAEYWQIELEEKKLLMYRGIPAPDDDEESSSAPPPQPANAASFHGAPPNGAPGFPAGAAPGQMTPPAPAQTPQRAPDADEEGYVIRGFYEDEEVPDGFEPLTEDDDEDGEQISRTVEIRHVWRYDTNGHEILGKPKPWAGKYIPIVPMPGKERIVEGQRFLLSAIRGALDSQQLYNYYKTTEAEEIQQTPKNPYVGALGSFKTMKTTWEELHRVPRTFVEYDPVVAQGQLLPPPQRQSYEPSTQALVLGAQAANEDIKATTGLFDPSRGQANANADSGVAIGLLQQQGETSTYHFFDNFLRAMWHGYRILVDLIPHIYDTPRVVRIIRPDSTEELVQINRMFTGDDGKRMRYNLAQGTYAIALSVQPSYQTAKQRDTAHLSELAKADPAQLPQWADLYVKQLALGPIGDQIADRLMPAQYRPQTGPNPQQIAQQAQQLAQQNQALMAQVHQLSQQLETKQYETAQKDAANERDNQTKLLIATMQEQTKRAADDTRAAIAEINARMQTSARQMADVLATTRGHEAMAHELAMQAGNRALALHDAQTGPQMPPGAPGAQPAGPAVPGAPVGPGGPAMISPGSVDPAALAAAQNPPPPGG